MKNDTEIIGELIIEIRGLIVGMIEEMNVMHVEEKVIEHQIVEMRRKKESIMKEGEKDMKKMTIKEIIGIIGLEEIIEIRI
jgi:hypothetical protein